MQLTAVTVTATIVAVAAWLGPIGASATFTNLTPACVNADGGCLAAIQNAFNACAGASSCVVSLAPGSYPVQAATRTIPLSVSNLSNVTLTGPGATIVLQNLTGAFQFSDVNGLYIQGVAFDMQREPYVTRAWGGGGEFAGTNSRPSGCSRGDVVDWCSCPQVLIRSSDSTG